jgi:hypothetical protein
VKISWRRLTDCFEGTDGTSSLRNGCSLSKGFELRTLAGPRKGPHARSPTTSILLSAVGPARGLFRDRYKGSLVVDDSALLKAMDHSRESNSAFLDLNSSSERIPF